MGKRALFVGVLVLVAAAFGVRDARAQARVVTGRVTSAQTGQPIGSANVSALGTIVATVTNERGEYTLSARSGSWCGPSASSGAR